MEKGLPVGRSNACPVTADSLYSTAQTSAARSCPEFPAVRTMVTMRVPLSLRKAAASPANGRASPGNPVGAGLQQKRVRLHLTSLRDFFDIGLCLVAGSRQHRHALAGHFPSH